MKACSKCGEVKPFSDFPRNPDGKNGIHSQCKACKAPVITAWEKRNPDKVKAKYKRFRIRHPFKWRVAHFKNRYGVLTNEAELGELWAVQESLCPICGRFISAVKADLEHDHFTRRLRGFTCDRCNTGLALLGDDPKRLKRAIEYLEDPPAEAFYED